MKMYYEILLIDDDSVVNFINSKILENEFGSTPIKVFKNGLLALEYIIANQEQNFMIFLDINMPIMNGWDFLDAVAKKKIHHNLEIHILTSSIDNADLIKASKYTNVTSFLHKPLKKENIKKLKER